MNALLIKDQDDDLFVLKINTLTGEYIVDVDYIKHST